MRAVEVRSFETGGAGLAELAEPDLPAGHVMIDVAAAGVGFATLMVFDGSHQNTPALPFVPGTEVAGRIAALGDGVNGLAPGQRVVACVQSGGFAERVAARADRVYAIPDTMSYLDATQFATIYSTGYAGLKRRAHLAPGEVLLVHGAGGGSGLSAVELGKAMGARVIASAGSADKLAVAREHGADLVINYREADFRSLVLQETGGRGADVVYDPVGGQVFDDSLRCMAPEGRILPMGFAGGKVPQIPANILLVKNLTVIGIYWGYYVGWAKQPAAPGLLAEVQAMMAEMFAWHSAGKLRPLTYRALDLADFAEALDIIRRREVIGRVALTTGFEAA